ncbi:MAG: FGGY family carbohydrate kinase [Ktedonobacteraceae bacterium]
MQMALLGIDLGTSSVKVIALSELGALLGEAKADYDVLSAQAGWAESDPMAWWSATVSAVRAVLKQAARENITAIGLAGQMHGVVLADQAGQPVRNALLWADNRAEAELERYHALPRAALQRLANPLVPGMAGPLLCWLARHEASSYEAARWALQPKDWLRFVMTGSAASDPGDASATLLYDLPADAWADDIITSLGLRRALFPPILPSSHIAGTLEESAARELGLPAGLPIATGTADTAAAALGTGLLEPGVIQLTLGTGAQLIQIYAQPERDPTGRTHLYRAADGAHWYAMAAVQNAGLALDWVRRVLGANWDEIYASASTVPPGSAGLTFLPYLTRERAHLARPASSAAFLDLRIDHQREHLLHAALEGVALGIRTALDALPGGHEARTLRLAGGGSAHPAWRQLLANVLGCELIAVETPAASARGAALLGGIAAGVWPDATATIPLAPLTRTVATPAHEQVSIYNAVYARYAHIHTD